MIKLFIRNPCKKCIVQATCKLCHNYKMKKKLMTITGFNVVYRDTGKSCGKLLDYHIAITQRRNFFLKWFFDNCRLCSKDVFKPLSRMYVRAPNTFCRKCYKQYVTKEIKVYPNTKAERRLLGGRKKNFKRLRAKALLKKEDLRKLRLP